MNAYLVGCAMVVMATAVGRRALRGVVTYPQSSASALAVGAMAVVLWPVLLAGVMQISLVAAVFHVCARAQNHRTA